MKIRKGNLNIYTYNYNKQGFQVKTTPFCLFLYFYTVYPNSKLSMIFPLLAHAYPFPKSAHDNIDHSIWSLLEHFLCYLHLSPSALYWNDPSLNIISLPIRFPANSGQNNIQNIFCSSSELSTQQNLSFDHRVP